MFENPTEWEAGQAQSQHGSKKKILLLSEIEP
jgi:hypothetical protein